MNSLIYKTWKPIIYKNAAVPSSKKGDFIRISPYVVPWAYPDGIGNIRIISEYTDVLHLVRRERIFI